MILECMSFFEFCIIAFFGGLTRAGGYTDPTF